MNQCKSCKHFKRETDGIPTERLWGKCQLAGARGSLFAAIDEYPYNPEFEVHETFGCVQWEKQSYEIEAEAIHSDGERKQPPYVPRLPDRRQIGA